jgi:hypothetical protein
MDWLWNWGGECFGNRNEDSLFTYFDWDVGRFDDDEIYGSNGRYLSEVKNRNRLLTDRSKSNWVKSTFATRTDGSYARYANYAALRSFHPIA